MADPGTSSARELAPDRATSVEPARAAAPMLRLLGELGSWSLGEPLAAGDSEVLVQVRLDALDELLLTLGGDGLRALIAVLRHAAPVRDGNGSTRLELPGFSGAWLRSTVGLSERAAYRASAALQDAGLLTTASLPGARGAEGKQRAVLSPLVGLPGGGGGVRATRRGRQTGSSDTSKRRNRRTDRIAVSTEPPNRGVEPQLGAVSTKTLNPSSTALSSRTKEGKIPDFTAGQPPDGQGPLPGVVGNLWAVQRALLVAERGQPGALSWAVGQVLADRAGQCARLADALRLGRDQPAAQAVTGWLLAALTADLADTSRTPGAAGLVLAQLTAAGIVLPKKVSTDELLGRLVAAAVAGLDANVSSWPGWLGSGLRRPASYWSATQTPRRFWGLLDEVRAQQQVPELERPAPPSPGAPQNRGTQGDPIPAPPTAAEHALLPPAAAGAGELDLVAAHLPAAVAASTTYSRWGVERVRRSPRLACALVRDHLAGLSDGAGAEPDGAPAAGPARGGAPSPGPAGAGGGAG